jgi:hypothetical protein
VGKFIATGAIMAGVMVLALPITIIVNNFMQVSRLGANNAHTLGAAAALIGPFGMTMEATTPMGIDECKNTMNNTRQHNSTTRPPVPTSLLV